MKYQFYHQIGFILLGKIVLLPFLFPCFGASKEEFDAVLSGYNQSIQQLEHASFSYQSEGMINDRFSERFSGKIFFDQKNFKEQSVGTRAGDGQNAPYETIIAPEWNRFMQILRDEQGEPTVMSCCNPENIPSIRRALGYSNFLFGWVFIHGEYVFLPDVLRSLGADHVTVTDSGDHRKEMCFVYRNEQCRMLLDAESFTMLFFESNALSGETIRYVYEVLESQNISGVMFPTKFVATSQIPSGKMADVYSLSDICFVPLSENDFQFSTVLPNGTPAHMRDAPHIEHIWRDGKIVPKTDEVMLAIAQGGHKFMPGPDEPRFWLMGVGIALIVCSGGVKIYQYFKNRKDK